MKLINLFRPSRCLNHHWGEWNESNGIKITVRPSRMSSDKGPELKLTRLLERRCKHSGCKAVDTTERTALVDYRDVVDVIWENKDEIESQSFTPIDEMFPEHPERLE